MLRQEGVPKAMYYQNEYRKECPCLGEEVSMTVTVEADGGSDCFVSWDRYEADCEKQSGCPYKGTEQCLLTVLTQ